MICYNASIRRQGVSYNNQGSANCRDGKSPRDIIVSFADTRVKQKCQNIAKEQSAIQKH